MICEKCKREIPDGSKFCTYCGSKLTEQGAPAGAAENVVTSEQPATEQPEAEQPETEQPATEQPAAEQPETEQPAAEQPAAEQPTAEQPAAEQPETEQPAVEQPAAEQPEAEQPAAEQSAAEQPAAEQPWYQTPLQPTQQQGDTPKKSHRKLIIGISVAAVLIVLLGVGIPVTMMVVRSNHYNEAESLLKKEKYEDAKKIFVDLDDYKNSKKNIEECDKGIAYQKANDLIDKEDYEGAQDVLTDLVADRYKDSAELEILCENKIAYAAAQKLLDEKSYYDAYTAFTALSGFEDADDKANSCIQPTPSTGELYRNEGYGDQTCPLTFENTTYSTFPTVLQITTPDGTVVSTLYIAGGESFTVNIPAGTYYLKRTIGMTSDKWFGNDELFGDLGMSQNLINPTTGDNNYTIDPNMIYTMTL